MQRMTTLNEAVQYKKPSLKIVKSTSRKSANDDESEETEEEEVVQIVQQAEDEEAPVFNYEDTILDELPED